MCDAFLIGFPSAVPATTKSEGVGNLGGSFATNLQENLDLAAFAYAPR
jgi:hypothetical protein